MERNMLKHFPEGVVRWAGSWGAPGVWGCRGFTGVGVLRALQADVGGGKVCRIHPPATPVCQAPSHPTARQGAGQARGACNNPSCKALNWTQPLWGRSWPKSSTFHKGVFTLGEGFCRRSFKYLYDVVFVCAMYATLTMPHLVKSCRLPKS